MLVLKQWKDSLFSPEWCSVIIGTTCIVHVERTLVIIILELSHSPQVNRAFIFDEMFFCAFVITTLPLLLFKTLLQEVWSLEISL